MPLASPKIPTYFAVCSRGSGSHGQLLPGASLSLVPSHPGSGLGLGRGGGFITCQQKAWHRTMPWEQNNSGEEDLFKGFGETGERMLFAQKVVQRNDLDDHSVIPDPGKVFLSQSLAM